MRERLRVESGENNRHRCFGKGSHLLQVDQWQGDTIYVLFGGKHGSPNSSFHFMSKECCAAFCRYVLCICLVSWEETRSFLILSSHTFLHADEKEENVLGSIPLLSFRVAAVQPSDNISRKYTFKVSKWLANPMEVAWHLVGGNLESHD